MKESSVTGEDERYGDENHAIDKTFGDYESAGTAGADCSLCASRVCRILRGGADRRNPPAEPEQRQSHTRWIGGTRSLRPALKKLRDGGCKARTLLHKSSLVGPRDRIVLHNPAYQRRVAYIFRSWWSSNYAKFVRHSPTPDHMGHGCHVSLSKISGPALHWNRPLFLLCKPEGARRTSRPIVHLNRLQR